MTAYELRVYETDDFFICRPTLLSAANMDVLIERIENLVSLIEVVDALTPVQKKIILRRFYGAEASGATATLNSLTCCRHSSAPCGRIYIGFVASGRGDRTSRPQSVLSQRSVSL